MADQSDVLQKILTDKLAPDEERALVEGLAKSQPALAVSLLSVYLQQKLRYRTELEACHAEARRLAALLGDPPWHPVTVIHLLHGDPSRALVAAGSRRVLVRVAPEVDTRGLRCGTPAFLNNVSNVLVGLADELPPSGAIGSFSRFHDGLAVIRVRADEEVVVDLAADVLVSGLKEGDLLLYDAESRVALARVDKVGADSSVVEEIPDVSFDDIGGLDELAEELKSEVALHVLHRDVAASHQLRPARGVILCGPPGCGKTMIAKALANYLAHLAGATATFLNVRPGIHRSPWYGQTEQNVRELFAAARRAATREGHFVIMLLDDVDHLGSRSDGISTTIDTRVLPSFLAEIDRLVDCPRVWLVAATNRPDLLDEALLRPGRFGDKVFTVPRPGREAAREILRKHLALDLPYWSANGDRPDRLRDDMIETALARLYSPNGEAATLATLVLRDGSPRPVTAADVISGALIAQAVAEAKRESCLRIVKGRRPLLRRPAGCPRPAAGECHQAPQARTGGPPAPRSAPRLRRRRGGGGRAATAPGELPVPVRLAPAIGGTSDGTSEETPARATHESRGTRGTHRGGTVAAAGACRDRSGTGGERRSDLRGERAHVPSGRPASGARAHRAGPDPPARPSGGGARQRRAHPAEPSARGGRPAGVRPPRRRERKPWMDVRLEIVGDQVVSKVDSKRTAVASVADFLTIVSERADAFALPDAIPEGVRFVRRRGPGVVVVIEEPPQLRTVRWLADDSPQPFGPSAVYRTVSLAFPFVVLVCALRDGGLTGYQQCFYRSAALRVRDDGLGVPPLPNVAAYAGMPCWLCLAKHKIDLKPLAWDDKVRELRKTFWGAAFNRSCVSSYWQTLPGVDARLASVAAWEQESKRDPFFPLTVRWRPVGQTVGQVTDAMLGIVAPGPTPHAATDLAALLATSAGVGR